MEIKLKVLEDIIYLVSRNMTGEVNTNAEIVRTLYRAGAEIIYDFHPECTTVRLGGVKFRTPKIKLRNKA